MAIVVFTDIDDTLMQAKRKCPPEQDVRVGAFGKDGEELSFITSQQDHLLKVFTSYDLIPVTGRNKDALDRVALDFNSYKVIDHGAIVLNQNNDIENGWLKNLQEMSKKWESILIEFNNSINDSIDRNNLKLRCRVIFDYGFACYISVKGDTEHLLEIRSLAQAFSQLESGARIHINDRNMAFLPPYTCKKKAVEYLQQFYLREDSNSLFIAAGDSSSDIPFMKACHFKVIPSISQISNAISE